MRTGAVVDFPCKALWQLASSGPMKISINIMAGLEGEWWLLHYWIRQMLET